MGIDHWKGARDVLNQRFEGEYSEIDGKKHLSFDQPDSKPFKVKIIDPTKPLKRNDDGLEAAPLLKTKKLKYIIEPPGKKMTRDQMFKELINELGLVCQGCDREFDHERYLQLDHRTLGQKEG